MTLFWVFGALLALTAGAFVALPLVRTHPQLPAASFTAAYAVIALFAAASALYLVTGTPNWNSHAPGSTQSISDLVRHLSTQSTDTSGWLALGQAYSSIGQYSLAQRAYERANRLTVGGNAAALAGMGEAITLSGDVSQAAKAQELLEHALQLDPHSAKALFYTAVAAMQSGQLATARERFGRMLELNPPENIQLALKRQIAAIDTQLHPAVDAQTAIHVHVTLAPTLATAVPPQGSLFVFVPAPQGGAPLAVKRLDPQLPQDVVLSATDAMIPGRALKPHQAITIGARISSSGSPMGAAGDLYGEIHGIAGRPGVEQLTIDRHQ
jgi:tetratricopeptide (TPR) repeat protein